MTEGSDADRRDSERGVDGGPQHVLDNPVWHALVGSQRSLGNMTALAARYQPDMAPFGALAPHATSAHWVHMAELIGPRGMVSLTGDMPELPESWTVSRTVSGVQLVLADGPDRSGGPDHDGGAASRPSESADEVEPLGPGDVPDMLRLVELAQPGPFRSRTVHFGGYVGIRRDGQLVAMAGERFRPPGYAEISAVATDPAHRRQGLAARLVRLIAGRIRARGEVPFLHVVSANEDAIRVYQALGFTVRREVEFVLAQAPH